MMADGKMAEQAAWMCPDCGSTESEDKCPKCGQPREGGLEEADLGHTVALLREAAGRLRAAGERDLVIPDFDAESLSNPYPLGIQPGTYRLVEVAEAVQFIADMLEE